MSKKALVVEVNQSTPANVQDWGLRSNRALTNVKTLASWGIDSVKGFPDSVAEDIVADFRLGVQHDHSLMHPAIEYAVIEGNYLKVADLQADRINDKTERVFIGVDYAFSFTPQQAGKIKETHSPELHKIVSGIRTPCNKHTSNVWNKMVAEGKKIVAERAGKLPERKGNLSFFEYLYNSKGGIFDAMTTRCKNAKAKGDEFADVDKLAKAIIAFNVVIKK